MRRSLIFALGLLAASTSAPAFALDEVIFSNVIPNPVFALTVAEGDTYADDVTFGGTSRQVTKVELPFLYESPTNAVVTANITLDIHAVDTGTGLPGALLHSSTLTDVVFTSSTNPVVNLTFSGLNVTVPNTIRWGVRVTNLRGFSEFETLGPQIGDTTSSPAGAANNPGPNGIFLKRAADSFFQTASIVDQPDVLAARFTSFSNAAAPGSLKIIGPLVGAPVETYVFEHTGTVGAGYILQENTSMHSPGGWVNKTTFSQTSPVTSVNVPASGLRKYFRTQLAP